MQTAVVKRKPGYPCEGCCYGKNHEICFPCLKDLMGQYGVAAWEKEQAAKEAAEAEEEA